MAVCVETDVTTELIIRVIEDLRKLGKALMESKPRFRRFGNPKGYKDLI